MNQNILIVGAGPSGLMLALSLLRNGVSVRIIAKEEKFVVGQRGCGLMPRTLEIHKLMGLLPEVLAMARPVPTIQLFSSPQGDTPIKTLELSDKLADTPFYPYINPLMLGQDRHEALLRKHLFEEYSITVELATQLVSLEQHSDRVTAHMVKMIDGKEVTETATFDWLVGADGAHSVVRKQLGIPFLGETREEEMIVVGDIHVRKGMENRKFWRFWSNSWLQKMVAMRPFEIEDDDRFNFMIGGSEIDRVKTASSREELIKTFYEVSGRTDVEFGELLWMGLWRPNIRMVNKFGEGRVFIVGDAAHVHTPAGGQGMNSSIQDSLNLAWKLALVQKGLSPASILDSYTKERLPVINSMLNNTTAVYETSIKHGNDGRGLARDFELRQFGVNYRGSSIILDERYVGEVIPSDPYRSGDDGLVRGGDRAPEAPGLVSVDDNIVTKSLFEVFKPTCHTVLIFSDPKDNQGALLEALDAYKDGTIQVATIYPQSTLVTSIFTIPKSAHRTFVDSEGYAYRHYNVTNPGTTIFVIRPDGYIGAYSRTRDGVVAYFEKILI